MKKLTLGELLEVLRRDFEGEEKLRLHALRDYAYYGRLTNPPAVSHQF